MTKIRSGMYDLGIVSVVCSLSVVQERQVSPMTIIKCQMDERPRSRGFNAVSERYVGQVACQHVCRDM
jgi:hypothetical protein